MKPAGDEWREMYAILACKGGRRSRSGRIHRPVYLYVHDGPWPLPPGWSPRGTHSTFELACRCGVTLRPGDAGMRALIEMAARKPDRILYIDGP